LLKELFLSGSFESISKSSLEKTIANFQVVWSAQVLFDISREYYHKGNIKKALEYHEKSQSFIENL